MYILNSNKIKDEILKVHNMVLSNRLVQNVLKKELNLKFGKIKRIAWQGNSERTLVLRQQFAIKLLGLLNDGKRIINIDESIIG